MILFFVVLHIQKYHGPNCFFASGDYLTIHPKVLLCGVFFRARALLVLGELDKVLFMLLQTLHYHFYCRFFELGFESYFEI